MYTRKFIKETILQDEEMITKKNALRASKYNLQEAYHIYFSVTQPSCTCGKDLKFLSFNLGYKEYCSKNCELITYTNNNLQLVDKDYITINFLRKNGDMNGRITKYINLIEPEIQAIYQNIERPKCPICSNWATLSNKRIFHVCCSDKCAGINKRNDKERTLYKEYCKEVYSITNKQPLLTLPNIELRGKSNVEGSYQLDHRYSIRQGFLDGILPIIIGDINNLEMIPSLDNINKGITCSIELEELYNS